MNNENFLKGILLVLIAGLFLYQSFHLDIGVLNQPGSGMFPLFMSVLLLILGTAIVIRARLIDGHAVRFQIRNIALVTGSLLAFVATSSVTNMLVGVAALVIISSLATDEFSVARSLKVFVFLAFTAIAMKKGLGFNLPLY